MCTGLEIAAIAAAASSAAGAGIQQHENNANTQREYNARNAAMLQGVQQQDTNAASARDILNTTIDKFQAPAQAQDLGSAIAGRTAAIQNNDVTPAAANPGAGAATAPKVVQSDLADKMAGATAFANQQAGALGGMGGIGDLLMGNSLKLNDSGNKIGQISNFAQGDAGVNRAQVEAAGHNARKSPGMLGQLLSTAGTMGSMATMGAGAFGGAGAGQAAGATLSPTDLPWRNTVMGLDAGPKFPTIGIPAPAGSTQIWSN